VEWEIRKTFLEGGVSKTHPKEEDYCNIEENGEEQNSIIGQLVYVWSR
jgi:hypothetical protein